MNLKSEPSNSFAGGSHNWSNKSDLAIEGSTRSNQGKDISDGSSSGVPIGLGLGGLHPKVGRCFCLSRQYCLRLMFGLRSNIGACHFVIHN